jgi:hypothetical protein
MVDETRKSEGAESGKDAGVANVISSAQRESGVGLRGSGAAGQASPLPGQPDELLRRFVRKGDDYLFNDGALAFTDRVTQLSTPVENSEVIRTMIEVAASRGWREIAVSGTERFRAGAGAMAVERGMEVRGYSAEAERREADARRKPQEAEPEPASGEPVVQVTPVVPRARRQDRKPIRGTLIEHGRARYLNESDRPMSYYATVRTAQGERTVWGVDLERSLREAVSRPQIGDEVVLRAVRQDPVTVRTVERDDSGATVEIPRTAARNRWSFETARFLEQRRDAAESLRDPASDPRPILSRQPELAGTYLAMRGAEEIARTRIPHKDDQTEFVKRVRAAVSDRIEQGEAAPAIPVRVHESKRTAAVRRDRELKERGMGD